VSGKIRNAKCYICDNSGFKELEGSVRDNPELKILKCANCGLVFLDNFIYDEKFYETNGMENTDGASNVINTTEYIDIEKRFAAHYKMLAGKSVLDFGCGSGGFLKKLKNEKISDRLYALEINQKYAKELSNEFNSFTGIKQIPDDSLDVITMFHVLEHLADPVKVLNELYPKLSAGGRIIIEVPCSEDALLNLYDCKPFKNFTYWSCHLFLFNAETMRRLFMKTNYKIDVVKQYQRYTLANHMRWLAKGLPGGHIVWSFMDDEFLQAQYEKKLFEIGQTDTVCAVIHK